MRKKLIGILLYVVLCYFPLFLHLDTLSLRMWDESRRGVNAMEMAAGGSLLVPHFEGHPDMYGTKPPLLVWLQAIGIKILGPGALPIRLPSALAGLATVLLLVLFSWKVLRLPSAGLFAGLILLTSNAYIDGHGAISGDYDALLTLWLTAAMGAYYVYLQSREARMLYLSGLLIILAGWTKGIAGMFFLPGMFLYTVLHQESRWVFRKKTIYLVAAASGMMILSYYFIREALNPGFLDAIWNNELYGRFIEAREGHQHGFWYYFLYMFEERRYFPWMYFFPFAFFWLLWQQKYRSLAVYGLSVIVVFFLIISSSQTKFPWYFLPVLPLASLLIGVSMVTAFKVFVDKLSLKNNALKAVLGVLLVLVIFVQPYIDTLKRVYVFDHTGWESEKVAYASYLERLKAYDTFVILHPDYNGHVAFYKQLYNRKEGYQIEEALLNVPRSAVQRPQRAPESLAAGELVLFCEQRAAAYMDQHYTYESADAWEECRLVKILTRN